jgi:tetratricopeptide (TPR) repeat protein
MMLSLVFILILLFAKGPIYETLDLLGESKIDLREVEQIRILIDDFLRDHRSSEALQLLSALENEYGSLSLGINPPSFYNMKGVALYEANRLREAVGTLEQAVLFNSSDLRAWINLVALKPHFGEDESKEIEMIEILSRRKNLYHAVKTMKWQNVEESIHETNQLLEKCIKTREEADCDLLTIGVVHQFLPSSSLKKYLELINIFQDINPPLSIPFSLSSSGLSVTTLESSASVSFKDQILVECPTPLKVGFILSRIDSGPVINLSHLLFKYLKSFSSSSVSCHSSSFYLVAFFLSNHVIEYSYQQDIVDYFDEVISLENISVDDSVRVIRNYSLDILIEMNGWNTNTGLLIMKERPAKTMMSFLGDPVTTGTTFIDYFISDKIVTPAETVAESFTEKMIFLPTCYLVNSYLEWQKNSSLLSFRSISRYHQKRNNKISFFQKLKGRTSPFMDDRSNHFLSSSFNIKDLIFIGTFHGWNKISPGIFHVWMNILRFLPNGIFVFSHGRNHSNLFGLSDYYGILSRQIRLLPHFQGFEEHYYQKSFLDLYLDTVYKNGHTTSLDAAFVGLPTVSLSGSSSLPSSRSTESIQYFSNFYSPTASSHNHNYGLVYSLKEYEDLVIKLLKSQKGFSRLRNWRLLLETNRKLNRLFNTKNFAKDFAYSLQAVVEDHCAPSKYNIFASSF